MFQITRNIWQGRFATPARLDELRRHQITHILNVSDSPNQLTRHDGPFTQVAWHPIEDLTLIPVDSAKHCIDILHSSVCDKDSNVYIHCVAGWNRSPTILWLYLVAAGMTPADAEQTITATSFDAVPGHSKLADKDLLRAISQHGETYYQPHPRPEAIELP